MEEEQALCIVDERKAWLFVAYFIEPEILSGRVEQPLHPARVEVHSLPMPMRLIRRSKPMTGCYVAHGLDEDELLMTD